MQSMAKIFLNDASMSGVAMSSLKSPSLLDFKKSLVAVLERYRWLKSRVQGEATGANFFSLNIELRHWL
jgi:hypothetical protein